MVGFSDQKVPILTHRKRFPVAVPGIFVADGAASSSADRCHYDSPRAALRAVARLHGACGRTSLRSLLPPPAALPSLPLPKGEGHYLPLWGRWPVGPDEVPSVILSAAKNPFPRRHSEGADATAGISCGVSRLPRRPCGLLAMTREFGRTSAARPYSGVCRCPLIAAQPLAGLGSWLVC